MSVASISEFQNPSKIKSQNSLQQIQDAMKNPLTKEQNEFFTGINDSASVASNKSGGDAFKSVPFTRNTNHEKHVMDKTKLEEEERMRLLTRMTRLSKRTGAPPITFSTTDSLVDLKRKNAVFTTAGRANMMIGMMKKAIVFAAKMIEIISKKAPGDTIDLDGWSSHLNLTIDTYDNILHECYEHYSDTFAKMSPVFTLVMSLGSSAVMYSITRKMLKAKESITNALTRKRRHKKQFSGIPGLTAVKKQKMAKTGDMSGPGSDTDARTVVSAAPSMITLDTTTLEKAKLLKENSGREFEEIDLKMTESPKLKSAFKSGSELTTAMLSMGEMGEVEKVFGKAAADASKDAIKQKKNVVKMQL